MAKKAKAAKKRKKKAAPGTAVAVYNPKNIVTETGAQVSHMLGMLMQFAQRKDVDLARLTEAKNLIIELMALQAKQNYSTAMAACQRAIPYMAPDRTAEGGAKQKWVTLEKMHRIAKPIIDQHGFSLSYGTERSDTPGWVRLKCDVHHTGGHIETYYAPDIPPDIAGPKGGENKTPVQGAGSSISYMRRYLMGLIFNITVAGEDNDGQTDTLTDAEVEMLRNAIAEGAKTNKNITIVRVCEIAKVENLQDIRKKDFGKIMATIANSAKPRK